MTPPENDGPKEPPPEGVRSTPGPAGPVPVRDLMTPSAPPSDRGEAEVESRPPPLEREFERADGVWIARNAGTGAYGTGRMGTARLVAVQFHRREEPGVPVREALMAAGRFPHLSEEELGELFDRATPIELER